MRRIMLAAYEEYRESLEPPSGAHDETVEDVAHALLAGGGLIARLNGEAAGSARYRPGDNCLLVERVAVLPEFRGRGIARSMMAEMETVARELGLRAVEVYARGSLPDNVAIYRRLGYRVLGSAPHRRGEDTVVTLRKNLTAGSGFGHPISGE
ncbi:MAG: GNAT family N-acetyltransferase [Chloroflexota bacterium]